MLPGGFEEVDNKERRHCGDRGEGGLEDAKLTRRSQGQGTLASEWFSNVFSSIFLRQHNTGVAPPWKDWRCKDQKVKMLPL